MERHRQRKMLSRKDSGKGVEILGPVGSKLPLQLAIRTELYSNYPVECKGVFLPSACEPPRRAPIPGPQMEEAWERT
jgi:hypothetical protein